MNETEKPNNAPSKSGETPPENAAPASPDTGGENDGINRAKLLGCLGCYSGCGCLTVLVVVVSFELSPEWLGGGFCLLVAAPLLVSALVAYGRGQLPREAAITVAFFSLFLLIPVMGARMALSLMALLAICCCLVWLWVKTRSKILVAVGVIVLLVWPILPPVASRLVVAFKETDWARFAEKPKQVFTEKPAFPEFLYIQDDTTIAREKAEENMLIRLFNYLDGVHLKAIALRNAEGKITLYRAEGRAFHADSKRCLRERDALSGEEKKAKWTQCWALWERELQTAQTLDDESGLPPMRYRAHFWQEDTVFLWWPLCRARYLDIYETASGKRIAWAERHDKATWWVKKLFDKKAGEYMEGMENTEIWHNFSSLEAFLTKVMFAWPKEDPVIRLYPARKGTRTEERQYQVSLP